MTLNIGIICYPTVGGSGVIATELGKSLAEKGYSIHFISSSLPFRLQKAVSNISYHQVEVNQYAVFQYPPYDIALASKMADVINREKLDILHVHYAIPHAVCAILAKQMAKRDVKIVTTLHGTDITVLGYDASLSDAIRFGIEESDAVTAVSEALIQQTDQLLQPNKKIVPVYNFVDERIYKPRDKALGKEEWGIPLHKKVCIHVSNFRAVKRVPDVIYAFAKVREEVDSVLILVGDGPEMKRVRNLIEDLGLIEDVKVLGKQDRLEEIYSMSDCMLLLSEKESFGLVALEAMACGVPCVGTNIGGIPEVIIHEETGFIASVGDIDKIAAYTIKLLTDSALHEKMGKASYDRVMTHFRAETITEAYEDVYNSVVSK
ncbi:N-acetyl-alpha-D-glucosaminyl L-malate synthase BshA [Bacillus fonticola]|uniref:N-acetyl-alpha-D-glucosaminyl L-malate synthase BshA n=1 Tax=Bacillus fonticola TaxID=2728853 RepID=UPI0014765CA1|nr:N-acetyl-alpha-D-glucosaminyl L-malate synthase BshA [Bacillus fonticola]